MADWPVTPPDRAPPPPGVVTCWRILMDTLAEETLYQRLPADERARADRYMRPGDRRRCIAARAGTRAVLEPILGRPAVFVNGPHGKPACAGDKPADAAWHFNVSHAGGVVLIALSTSTPTGTPAAVPVGVDVEAIRPMPNRDTLARRFFHPAEVRDIAALREPEATEAFFRCWTRKEAVIKALGMGLSMPLACFRVSCRPEAPAALLVPPPGTGPWTLFDLDPAAGHRGALAVEADGVRLSLRTLVP